MVFSSNRFARDKITLAHVYSFFELNSSRDYVSQSLSINSQHFAVTDSFIISFVPFSHIAKSKGSISRNFHTNDIHLIAEIFYAELKPRNVKSMDELGIVVICM